MRGQVTAIYLFAANMFGIGLGPTVVALVTDKVFQDDLALGSSIFVAIGVSGPLALILLWFARAAYKKTLANVDFS